MKGTESKVSKDEDSNTIAVKGRFKIIDKMPEDAVQFSIEDLRRLSSQDLSEAEKESDKYWQEKVLASRSENHKEK